MPSTNHPTVRAQSRDEAFATLQRAAEAGLVHSVSNNQRDLWYICNCCTCSCGILRGMAEMGLAGVVAHSDFVSQVDEALCILCGECVERCSFEALALDTTLVINSLRCAGLRLVHSGLPRRRPQPGLSPGKRYPSAARQPARVAGEVGQGVATSIWTSYASSTASTKHYF